MRKDKPVDVKIIQAFSHVKGPTGGSQIAYFHIYGLGDDGKIYEHNNVYNTWFSNEVENQNE